MGSGYSVGAWDKGMIHFLGGIGLSARDFITVLGMARNPKMKPRKGKPREEGATVYGVFHIQTYWTQMISRA